MDVGVENLGVIQEDDAFGATFSIPGKGVVVPPVTPVINKAMLAVLEGAMETEVKTCCQMRSLLASSNLLKFLVARFLCFMKSCCFFLLLERMG